MLGHDEQRTWDEIRRRYGEEAREPARPVLDRTVRRSRSSAPGGLLASVVAGGCLAVVLVVVGAPFAGLVVAVATVPRWLAWRYWHLLDGGGRPAAPTPIRGVPLDTGRGHPQR